jgi:MFS family permease
VDLAPLRHREFRLLYAGQMISFAGSMLTAVALPYQTYELTGSSLAVGLIGLAEVIPMVGLALITGALADIVDRRRLVMIAEVGAALAGLLLVANALLESPQ